MKRKKNLLAGIIILFVLCLGVSFRGDKRTVQAISKKQVQKKIATMKKEIKSLEKKKVAAEKKEKKQEKGTTAIMGTIISRHPFIVYQNLWGSETYYWVLNSQNLSNLITQTIGDVKLTGKYRKYNGVTCSVCKAVKISKKSLKYKTALKKKKKQLSDYQNCLKEKMILRETEIEINQKQKVDCEWKYSGKYNKVEWKSSNPKVATIDSKGVLKGISQGKTVITAKCSLSKTKTQCTVYVWDYFDVYNDETGELIDVDDEITIYSRTLQLRCEFSSPKTKDSFTYECSSEGNIASITQNGLLTFRESGVATVKVSSSYVYQEFTVYSYNRGMGEDDNDLWDDGNNRDEYTYWDNDECRLAVYYNAGDGEAIDVDGDIYLYSGDTVRLSCAGICDGEEYLDVFSFIYECERENDEAEITEDGLVTFCENGTATVRIYTKYKDGSVRCLKEFLIICTSYGDECDSEECYG